jgi:hypothetical protein
MGFKWIVADGGSKGAEGVEGAAGIEGSWNKYVYG